MVKVELRQLIMPEKRMPCTVWICPTFFPLSLLLCRVLNMQKLHHFVSCRSAERKERKHAVNFQFFFLDADG